MPNGQITSALALTAFPNSPRRQMEAPRQGLVAEQLRRFGGELAEFLGWKGSHGGRPSVS